MGHEMISTLRQRSQNVFELKAGTLYPLLHTMEEKKLLQSYEQEIQGKIAEILQHYQRRPQNAF